MSTAAREDRTPPAHSLPASLVVFPWNEYEKVYIETPESIDD